MCLDLRAQIEKNTLESSICLQHLNRLQLSYALGHTGRSTTGEDM